MIIETKVQKLSWLEQARQLLQAACTPWGIKASLTDTSNYGAIFTRDAVMTGIAGVLLKDEIIVEGFKNSLLNLMKLQGAQGQIASNFLVKNDQVDRVSFGTLSPKIDSCTWYMIGVGLLIKEGIVQKNIFQESIEKTIALLDGLEYNGKHLMYIPKGGNWADEYIYEGYVLYDQVLRAWGLSLLGQCYGNLDWSNKAQAILNCVEEKYKKEDSQHYHSSFYPGGSFERFDLAAHTLVAIVFGKESSFLDKSLDWIINKFIKANQLPPAFYPAITETDKDWDTLRKYHLFDFKNKPHHYHNGGIWWIWLGWLAVALSIQKKEEALKQLTTIAFNYLDQLEEFDFEEYVSADRLIPDGTHKLCYTATGITFLSLAQQSFDFGKLNIVQQSLINEPLELKPAYFKLSTALVEQLKKSTLLDKEKLVIGVCGESGSGKSITAKCLQIELEKLNISSIILHQDSYYKLPPKDNHEKRKADISWVGLNEIQIDLFQDHIEQFKSNQDKIMVPIVDYEKNSFSQAETFIKDKTVLIVEGVYSFYLENLDYKIFMEQSYKETLEKRKNRTREVYDPFVEQVLDIEHQLILPLKQLADSVVNSNYVINTTQ